VQGIENFIERLADLKVSIRLDPLAFYIRHKAPRLKAMRIDWRECAAAETVAGKMAGRPEARGSRVRPQDLLINRDQEIDWLSQNQGIEPETIRKIFAFYGARRRARAPHPGARIGRSASGDHGRSTVTRAVKSHHLPRRATRQLHR
jgi:uncharacterized protein (DUF433 family)